MNNYDSVEAQTLIPGNIIVESGEGNRKPSLYSVKHNTNGCTPAKVHVEVNRVGTKSVATWCFDRKAPVLVP
jgi:hypothetical protein